jgi:hypothetical protein
VPELPSILDEWVIIKSGVYLLILIFNLSALPSTRHILSIPCKISGGLSFLLENPLNDKLIMVDSIPALRYSLSLLSPSKHGGYSVGFATKVTRGQANGFHHSKSMNCVRRYLGWENSITLFATEWQNKGLHMGWI